MNVRVLVVVAMSGLMVLSTLGACAGSGAKSGPTKSAPPAEDVSAWSTWTKVNATRKKSGDHSGMFVDVYVEPAHLAAYKAGTSKFPVGMKVVKAQYASLEGTTPKALTVMVKKAAGYDAENGDWYYAMMNPLGTAAKMQGKMSMCIDCHDSADNDYLFGFK